MNKKLTSILLAFGLLFGPTVGHAQQKDVASSDSKKGLDRMSKELGLSADQRSKVGAIFEIERNKVEAIFNEERQKLQVVQQDTRASLEGVLTAEQMNKLDQKMRENAKNEAKKK
jgi:Spy/CpxP family protein refolding chaperone